MAKNCLNHKEQPAVTMCHQCHHPICKSCVTVTPHGSFCSSECSILNKQVVARLAGSDKSAKSKLIMLIVMVLFLSTFFIHFFARSNESLRGIDIIGRFVGYPEKE